MREFHIIIQGAQVHTIVITRLNRMGRKLLSTIESHYKKIANK